MTKPRARRNTNEETYRGADASADLEEHLLLDVLGVCVASDCAQGKGEKHRPQIVEEQAARAAEFRDVFAQLERNEPVDGAFRWYFRHAPGLMPWSCSMEGLRGRDARSMKDIGMTLTCG